MYDHFLQVVLHLCNHLPTPLFVTRTIMMIAWVAAVQQLDQRLVTERWELKWGHVAVIHVTWHIFKHDRYYASKERWVGVNPSLYGNDNLCLDAEHSYVTSSPPQPPCCIVALWKLLRRVSCVRMNYDPPSSWRYQHIKSSWAACACLTAWAAAWIRFPHAIRQHEYYAPSPFELDSVDPRNRMVLHCSQSVSVSCSSFERCSLSNIHPLTRGSAAGE